MYLNAIDTNTESLWLEQIETPSHGRPLNASENLKCQRDPDPFCNFNSIFPARGFALLSRCGAKKKKERKKERIFSDDFEM